MVSVGGGRRMSEKITVKDIVDIYEKLTDCNTCWVARYINLEDDDTPCQNCEEPDAD